jgi:3-mercaptopyruvate sulfurtransferase SseA
VALLLRRKGITRVHPLQGGLAAWMALHFPVQQLQLPETQESENGQTAATNA